MHGSTSEVWRGVHPELGRDVAVKFLTSGGLAEAELAARKAVTALPDSPVLWQILISLSGAEADVVARARAACPDDAELWLADLVVQTHPKGGVPLEPSDRERLDARVHTRVTEAIDAAMVPAVLARAAEYLWRTDRRAADRIHGCRP